MRRINIGCACNDFYAQHLGIMIYSMLKNCSKPEKINIFVIDGGISKENKEKINSIAKRYFARIYYLSPNRDFISGLKECRHITKEAYYRFLIIENKKIKKLIYLDADLIVIGDIKQLWEVNLGSHILYAATDPGASSKKKESLGINPKSNYFNSGVMLINCEKWRKEKITQKTFKFIRDNPEKIEYADQDGLNVVLTNKWGELGLEWNVITRLVYYQYFPFLKKTDEIIKEIIKHPKIIHYATFVKPWYFLDPSPYKNVYWTYLKETPWKDYKQPDKNIIGIIKRIMFYFKIIKNKIV